ncbi:MAG: CHASE4 domain-containing protein [Desulfovibrionaceae bacterium]|nr:CHASE4 domain-containing protein [Desulfovibrionaceae bacterium]
MTLRATTISIVFLIFTALFGLLYAVTHHNLLSSFQVLERKQVSRALQRAENALKGEFQVLGAACEDWAAWDDTYAFMQHPGPAYVASNITGPALSNLHLDLILFFDESGRLVLGKSHDPDWNVTDVADRDVAFIPPDSPLFLRGDKAPGRGLVMTPSGPLLAVARPIMSSDKTGPTRGTLVMARYLDEHREKALSEQIGTPVRFYAVADSGLSRRLVDVAASLRREGQYQIVPEGEDSIKGYALVRDIFGEPGLVMEIDADREMHRQGVATLRYNVISLAAIGLTFGLGMHYLVEKRILSRITGLGSQIAAIRRDPQASRDIRVSGNDEITALATAIREMLEQMERAGEKLAESENRYEMATRAAKVGVWDYDFTSGALFIDPSLKALLGYQDAEIENSLEAWLGLVEPEDRQIVLEVSRDAQRDRAAEVIREYRLVHRDGGLRWIMVRGLVQRDAAGSPVRFLGTGVDVTELKLAEQSVRHLTREIITAQELERFRIARELHDNVAQDLSSLKISCETLFESFPKSDAALLERFSETSRMLQRAITFIREMAYALRPSNLDHLGFLSSVERFCADFGEKTGITARFLHTGMEGVSFDAEAEINLFRVIQEALGNVRRHSGATEVAVKIVASHPFIIVRVEDNGSGFDVSARMATAMEEKRMGLWGMRERIKLLGGTLRILSAPGQGTRIIAEIPAAQGGRHGGQTHSHH